MPPGVHLYAEIAVVHDGRKRVCQVRILGDQARGYLLSGLAALPAAANEEFWFESLHEAQGQAARFGIPESEWEEISDVADVRP